MNPNLESTEPRVLVLGGERLGTELMAGIVARTLPQATVQIATRLKEAQHILLASPPALIVTGTDAADGDLLDFLFDTLRRLKAQPKVLLILARLCEQTIASLRLLPLSGAFDATNDGAENLQRALRAVAGGQTFWSHSILDRLTRRPRLVGALDEEQRALGTLCRQLTASEQVLLATLGDGSDDREAGSRLGRSRSSIRSARRLLHRKLNVHHKGELMRFAIQHGFVRFDRGSIVRPGFSILESRCRKRATRAAAIAAP